MTITKLTARLGFFGSAAGLVVGFISSFQATARPKTPVGAAEEIREVESKIDRIEAATMVRLRNGSGDQF
jgi:hypothetical protein